MNDNPGTRLYQDIAPGQRSSSPMSITASGGLIYFTADDGVTGRELWAMPRAAPGVVPQGAQGEPLKAVKGSGGEVVLTWDRSCVPYDGDYAVYEGRLGAFPSHQARACSTGGATGYSFLPDPASTYYLVVPRNLVAEGSYGRNGAGEVPQATSPCLPQLVGACF